MSTSSVIVVLLSDLMFDYADVVVIVLFFVMLGCMFVAAVGNAAVQWYSSDCCAWSANGHTTASVLVEVQSLSAFLKIVCISQISLMAGRQCVHTKCYSLTLC